MLVEPVPARPGELEVGREVKHDALVDRFLEPRVEVDVGVGGQAVAVVSALHRNSGCSGLCLRAQREHCGCSQQRLPQSEHVTSPLIVVVALQTLNAAFFIALAEKATEPMMMTPSTMSWM